MGDWVMSGVHVCVMRDFVPETALDVSARVICCSAVYCVVPNYFLLNVHSESSRIARI